MKNEKKITETLGDQKSINPEERFDVLDAEELSSIIGSGGIYYDECEDPEDPEL